MSRKRTYLEIAVLAMLIILLIMVVRFATREKAVGVTVATASRELALMLADRETIEAAEDSRFVAGERDNWYVPYMDYLFEKDLLNSQITAATAECAAAELTMEALKVMADGLGVWQHSDVWQDVQVTPELWTSFLTEVMGRFGEDAVQTGELSIFGTAANVNGVKAWHVITDNGEYTFGGFSMDSCLDCQVQAWIRGREIIRVQEVKSREVNYENMLVKGVDEDSLTVFFAGYSRVFAMEEAVDLYPDQIIDLRLSEGQIRTIRRKTDTVDSRIIAVESDSAELEGYGSVPFASNMRVYQTYGTVSQKSSSDIIIGYDIYDVVVAEGEICAILIRQSPDAKTIRVLLTEGSGAVKKHASVSVTSRSDFTVTAGTETLVFRAGDTLTVDGNGVQRLSEDDEAGDSSGENGPKENDSKESDSVESGDEAGGDVAGNDAQASVLAEIADGQRLVIAADCDELTVTSLTRSFGKPTYPGKLELLYQDGGFYLINETTVEDYLCYVVPAEMPVDYHIEALKRGEDIVTTYYFSTSCGYTSDLALWGEDPTKSPHLTSKRLSGVEPAEDIQDEEVFRAFIMNTGLNDYETAYGWYRWNTTVTLEELTATVNSRLANLSSALKSRVLTRQRDGSWKEGASGVGQVESIAVIERGAGGVASVVEICGSQNTVRLLLQSAIREVLGSSAYAYQRMNGSVITGWANLPSAYFCLEPVYTDGELTGYSLYGGGSGHGVGMSQNCANAMGQSGVDARTMLRFFYDGTEVTQLYQ